MEVTSNGRNRGNAFNRISLAAAVVATGLVVQSAHAAGTTLTWIGGSGDAWSNPAKWTINAGADTTPLAGDIANVNTAGGILLSGAQSVGQLNLSGTTGTIDIGNGVTTDLLTFDNTGGVANSEGNTNAGILSAGTATNVISAPIRIIGTAGGTNVNVLQGGTQNLNLSGGVRIDSTTAGAAGFSKLNNNMASATLDVGDVTSISTVAPTATITNTILFGNLNNSTTTTWGTINLNGVISNGAPVGGFNVNTSAIFGAGGAGNTNNTISDIHIKGNNTFSGAAQLFRANIYLESNTAFGTGTVQSGGGFSGNLTGANLISNDDSRTLTNNMSLARGISIKGSNSLTFANVNGFVSSNTLVLTNMLAAGKTFTLGSATSFISTATTDTGRVLTVDGSGTTVFAGKVINNLGGTSLTVAPTDAGSDGRINKAGLGLLKLTNSANTFKAYAAASGGTIEFADAGSTSTAWMAVNPGGAIGVDTGSLAIVPARIAAGASGFQVNKGAIALATADASTNIDYTTDPSLSNALNATVGIGALPGGVTYTGTITPAANTYRLGGGATLTMPNTNALTDAAGPTARNAIFTNGGTVALTGTNNYTGTTTIEGNYIQSIEELAKNNQQYNTINTTVPVMQGTYQKTTVAVSKIGNGASSLGNAGTAASNLTINGGVLQYTGTGETSSRLFTVGTEGATLDASGTGAVNFSNTGAIVSAEAPTTVTATVATNNTLTAVNDISNLTVGMTVSGTGIAAGTTIKGFRPVLAETGNVPGGLNYQYQIYLSANGTAAGTAVPLTFGNAARTLNLTGSNTADNNISGLLSDATTGTLGVAKSGAGTWKLSAENTYTGNTTVNAGTLKLGGGLKGTATAASAVSVANGAKLEAVANGGAGSVSRVKSVNTNASGLVELHDNDLVVDYTGGSSSYVATVNQVKSGLALLGGSGTGIGSTDVDNQTVQGTMLAVVDDGDANIAGAITSTSGYTLPNPASSVIVKYTWFGDSNLDGIVDGSDYALLDSGFTSGGSLGGWVFGDYDYSGVVDGSDYALIDTGFISQNAVLPEPTTLGLLGLGAMGMLRRRRQA